MLGNASVTAVAAKRCAVAAAPPPTVAHPQTRRRALHGPPCRAAIMVGPLGDEEENQLQQALLLSEE